MTRKSFFFVQIYGNGDEYNKKIAEAFSLQFIWAEIV